MAALNGDEVGFERGEDTLDHDDSDMLTVLARSGVVCPPGALSPGVQTFGPWQWGTVRLDPFALYRFDIATNKAAHVGEATEAPPFGGGRGGREHGDDRGRDHGERRSPRACMSYCGLHRPPPSCGRGRNVAMRSSSHSRRRARTGRA